MSVKQEQASLIRCRSPVHIHVDDTTPVHVHVQKKKLEGISVSVRRYQLSLITIFQPNLYQPIPAHFYRVLCFLDQACF